MYHQDVEERFWYSFSIIFTMLTIVVLLLFATAAIASEIPMEAPMEMPSDDETSDGLAIADMCAGRDVSLKGSFADEISEEMSNQEVVDYVKMQLRITIDELRSKKEHKSIRQIKRCLKDSVMEL